jgi:hypothetical protein
MGFGYIIALALLLLFSAGLIALLTRRAKDILSPVLRRALVGLSLTITVASLAFCAIGVATGTFFIKAPDPFFNPDLNGYHENRPATLTERLHTTAMMCTQTSSK